jgi:hypothetical protein
MKYTKNSSQVLAWKPTPYKIPEEERSLEKVGNLLSNVTSEFIGSSLCPRYSKKQLRKINRLGIDSRKRFNLSKKDFKKPSTENKRHRLTSKEIRQ